MKDKGNNSHDSVFNGFIEITRLTVNSARSDLAVLSFIAVFGFLGVIWLCIYTYKGSTDTFVVISIMAAYVAILSICSIAIYFTNKHASLDSLEKLREAVEKSTKSIRDMAEALPEKLAFLDMVAEGEIDIRDPKLFIMKWTSLMNRAKNTFYAVNYISADVLLSGDYDRCFNVICDRKELGDLHVARLFLVDSVDEARKIWPIIEKHKKRNIDAGYMLMSEAIPAIRKYGFSEEGWDKGFIIIDSNAVALFKLENRIPARLSIVSGIQETAKYEKLYDSLRHNLHRNPDFALN